MEVITSVYSWINSVVLFLFWSGSLIICLVGLYLIYHSLFMVTRCPKCRSSKTAMVVGNINGGYRCGKDDCNIHYWLIDGKTTNKKPNNI